MDGGDNHPAILWDYLKSTALTLLIAVASACIIVVPSYAQLFSASFDHFSTGFPLTGSHVSVDCASCHVAGRFKATPRQCFGCHNGAVAAGKSQSHQQTAATCEACHLATIWSDIRRIDHTQTTASCANCHNGKIAIAKSPNHIYTIAPCQMCHTSTASFAIRSKMDHSGITASCATCHNGVAALGKASSHIPTNLPCETCHTSTVTFAGAAYAHQPSDTNCISCHNNVVSLGMATLPHIPTGSIQCSNCHTNTSPSFAAYTMNHTAVSGTRCDSCHNGSYASQGTKGAYGTAQYPSHVITSGQDCGICHAGAATSYISWAGGTYVHGAGDTTCSSCHNGATATGKITPPHIPTTAQCSNCHASTAASFITYTMNHSAVSTSRCDSCHNGSFANEGTAGAQGTASFPGHVATAGRDCVTCHASAAASFTSWAGAKYIHVASDTNCSSCHNGSTALGMTTPPHVPVGSVQCGNCHSNTAASFVSYTMNHASVSSARCDSCHNGSYAAEGTKGAQGTASYSGHVATTGRDCVTCHAAAAASFASWAGGVYAHQASDTNCSSCHNGTAATGKTTPPHIPTTTQCSNCHTNTAASFVSYTMNHSAVSTSRCDSCHNGSYTAEGTKGAQGTASYAGHVATTGRDCVTCHATATGSFTSWTGGVYAHQAGDTNCSNCHNGTTATGKNTPPHIPTTAQCNNCHTNTAASFVSYTMNHSAVSSSRCDTCHNGSYTAEGTKGAQGTASYPGHVVTAGRDCGTCHTSAAASFTSWAGGTYLHQVSDVSCTNCHNGLIATGMVTPPHIPTGVLQCSNCHSNTAASFVTYAMSHSAVSGSRCDSCHNGSYTAEGTKGAQGVASYAGHVATNGWDCLTCHTSAAASFTSWAGGTYVHKPTDTNCSSCHNGTTATGKTTPPHVPTTAQCSNCHVNTAASFITYTMDHSAVSASRCDTCHNGYYTAEGTKGAQGTASYPNHVATSGRDCISCHASTGFLSWAGGTYAHQASDTNCLSCHNGTAAAGMTTPPHIPTSSVQCSSCHTNTAASFVTYTMNHSAVGSSRCDACHNGSYTAEGTKGAQGIASYAGHLPTNGKDCIACHAKAASGFTNWSGATYVHAVTDTNCANCHNGTIATGKTTPPHIPTTAQCSSCHTNTAASFVTYTMNHTAVNAARCDTCHNGAYTSQGNTGAYGTASYAGHVATGGRDCGACHASAAASFVSWAGGTYVHQTADTNCSTCHNGSTATGMTTPPHIPTATVQCSNCHSNSAASFATYTMSHAAVGNSRCDSCHNGSYTTEGAKGALGTASYVNHVATSGQDCAACHASAAATFMSWAGGTYIHQATDTNCSTCHNGKMALGMTTPPHVPVGSVQCSNCHSNSSASFVTYTMSHSAVSASRCDSCHNGSYTGEGTKGAQGTASYAGHVATNGWDCTTCHASAAASFTSWAGGKYVHQASDTNCSTCHNGTTALGIKTPPHIPSGTAQCSNCHTSTATSFVTYTMSHTAVSAIRCDSCHNGSYTGEGTNGAQGIASFPGHVALAGRDCATCHASAAASFTSWAGGKYTHLAGDTNCSSCHNGTTALGMTTPPHVPTTAQCSNCHVNTAASFVTYTMNHSAVSASRCDSCHNGSYTAEGTKGAQGTVSYPGHVTTSGRDCLSCHASAAASFTNWAGGVYTHQATDTNCSSCHNGTTATGKTTPPHVPTTAQCSNCHVNTAASFITYTMNHSAVSASRCDSCHNGSYTAEGTKGAQGIASYSGHVATIGRDCVTCHATATGSFTSWAGGIYTHQATDTNCSNCHNGTTATGKTTPPHIPTTAQCSNCHVNTVASFITYTMNHSAVSASRCDSCHNGSYTAEGTKGALGTASYPNHVTTSGRDCGTCHTSAAASFTSWAGGVYTHQASDTNCSSCHNGTTATGLTTPPHIPTGVVQCSNCHSNAAVSFVSYTMKHSAVSGNRCDSCHNGSYTAEGTKGALGTASYPGHVATGGRDCLTCHTAAAASFASWAGGVYAHQAADTNCSSCHNGTTATGKTTPPHIPATAQCSNCHVNTAASFITYTMNHSAVSASRCDSCHNGSYTAEGTKGAQGTASYSNHVATGGRDCIICHAGAATSFSSWAGGGYVHQAGDTNCSNCHNGTTATGKTTPPHIPTTAQCSNCHVNTAASFITYTMNHSAVSASRCDSCHNGSYTAEGTKGAQGTASYSGHVATGGRDCVACHASAATSFTSWSGGTYVHQATDTNCSGCHNGATATGMVTPPHIPTGTIQCSNCHTNTATSFTTYTMTHSAVSGRRCDSCHNGAYTSQGTKGAYGTASYSGHVPTSGQDCTACHASAATTFTSWAGGKYVHQASDTNCIGCHNGTTATAMTTPPQIPTGTIQCSNCHTNTAASFTTYTMSHTAVTSIRCDACHNGSYKSQGTKGAQAKPSDHPKVTQDCGCCHTSTTSWGSRHSAGTCTTTAKAPVPAVTVAAAVKSAVARAAGAVTAIFRGPVSTMVAPRPPVATTAPATTVVTRSGTAPAAPSTGPPTPPAATATHPIATGTPTSDAGTTPTTTAISNSPLAPTGFVKPSATIPVAPTATFMKVAPVGATAVAKPGVVPPVPATTSPTTVTTLPVGAPSMVRTPGLSAAGNAATGPSLSSLMTPPKGNVRPLGPNADAIGAGGSRFSHPAASSGCVRCHNGRDALGKLPKHVTTNASCENCHKSTTTFAGARLDHRSVTAACATCHTGVGAVGKPVRHVATAAPCESCHKSTTTFAGARLDHRSVTAACATCHTGVGAVGKPARHVATAAPCESCHKSTTTFAGARLDHRSVTAACATCHTGAAAIGKPPRHLVTNASCDSCHKSTVSFAGTRVDHATLTARCVSCHNGTTAAGAGAKHFMTTLPCDACHRTTTWTSVTYRHSSPFYPNHGATIECRACHTTNTQIVSWKFAAYKPDCAACHAASFRPQAHTKSVKPTTNFYMVGELKDCTGACHIYTDKTLTTIQTRRSNMHRMNGRGW